MSKKKSKTKKRIRKPKTFIQKVKNISYQKKIALISAVIVMFIAILSASTYAWFTVSDLKENQFKGNFKYSVELIDQFKTPEKLEFGKTYDKKVSVKNTGDIPAFARILLFPEMTQGDYMLPIDDVIDIKYNVTNDSNWLLGEDGYYYYTKIIMPSMETNVLFDQVVVDMMNDEVKQLYNEADFKIDVKMESVDYRDNEYRFSWWQNRDAAPTEPRLKQVDDLLQKEKR